jgi:hypothetical protein
MHTSHRGINQVEGLWHLLDSLGDGGIIEFTSAGTLRNVRNLRARNSIVKELTIT